MEGEEKKKGLCDTAHDGEKVSSLSITDELL